MTIALLAFASVIVVGLVSFVGLATLALRATAVRPIATALVSFALPTIPRAGRPVPPAR